MKLKILFILVFFTQQSFADDSVVNSVKFAQEIITNSPKGTIDTSCIECSAVTEQKKDMFCEDLYEAACFDKDGKHAQDGVNKTKRLELMQIIKDARDKTAKALGYKNTYEYLQTEFKKNGLELAEGPEVAHWENLMDEEVDTDYRNANKLKFKLAEECQKEKKELDEISSEEKKEEKKAASQKFVQKYQHEKNKLLAGNIPEFIKNSITNKCSNFKTSDDREQNKKLVEVCSNIISIRKEAINLYRLEGEKGYTEKALSFVEKYSVPAELYYTGEAEGLEEYTLTNDVAISCGNLSMTMNTSAKKLTKDLLSQIAKSKPTVEYLIEKYYTKEARKKYQTFFDGSLVSIEKLLPEITNDKNKIKKIMSGYRKLEIDWMTVPKDDLYESGKLFNLPVLKESSDQHNPYSPFANPSLARFSVINAFYYPDITTNGYVDSKEKVQMLPAFISMIEKSPYTFLGLLAHEMGHKIGPSFSRVNGHDLRDGWKELLQCYEKKESIKLVKNQSDETISDYISSVVLSDMVSRLPKSERRAFVKDSVQWLCLFDDSYNSDMYIDCKEDHADNPLRVSGVIGANPVLREAVGCMEPSTKFKSCGLKKAKK